MHINSKHQNKYIHNCKICGYGTNNKQSMTSHRINEHTSKEKAEQMEKFICSICQNISLQSSFYRSIYTQEIVQLGKKIMNTECKPSKWVKTAESGKTQEAVSHR